MNILDQIVANKKIEVELNKLKVKVSDLTKTQFFERENLSLSQNLKNSKSGIIAEFKRKSPSKSIINIDSSVSEVVLGYQKAGACGISILTDNQFFGGNLEDVILARNLVETPILRKEFIIDEYQIIEAKSSGADCILLIAAILSPSEIQKFSIFAKSLDLEVLLEVHEETELERNLFPSIDMIGVNNRNLKTFQVYVETSKTLSGLIPKEFVKVSESGISEVKTVNELREFDFEGFLIGENFMKTNDPGSNAIEFIKQVENGN
ncbi:indole-3-glycerol phosphate synthase TrpC [Moheibacter sediminis]|uniref:indole-3-glycerol-phosphate synthase n=1 Tax=Moheibacter sediminis TaxID=1434700 RepID=A0A1W1YIV3_9FLAO|nr:indole-3-glycerol phosphate synthase TrpC [Moheibacter sediminis]SMC36099.1 indole-3-glycerol phosphate synthase [Moheibacter sediminis]